MYDIRVGQGIDIHGFVLGRPLILGGVNIPHEKGLDGHSDADVLLHALIDALLGAAGLPDIGTLFPNSDPRWKGASSIKLLELAWAEVQKKEVSENSKNKYNLINADIALVLEAPKLASYIPAMKERIAAVLNVESSRIGIKVTTAEGLGFVGREEGVFASAVVLIGR